MNKENGRSFKKRILIIIVFIFLFLISVFSVFLYYFNNKMVPLLVNYSQIEIEKIVNSIINNSTNDANVSLLEGDIINVLKNDRGDIQLINFDPVKVNMFLDEITNNVQSDLERLSLGEASKFSSYSSDDKGVIFSVPFGALTSNVLLSELGPDVPVRLRMIGYINSNIQSDIKEYGINNALLEVYVEIETKTRVVFPFASEDIIVTNRIPVAVKILQGNVPEYYQNGISSNSNLFSLPLKWYNNCGG